MADDKPRKRSKWEETLETCRKLKDEGRLDEIEPVPDEVHERGLETGKVHRETGWTVTKYIITQ